MKTREDAPEDPMAKRTYYSTDVNPDLVLSKGHPLLNSKVPAIIAGILLAIYVVGAFRCSDLSVVWQRLAGIGCALLAVVTYALATRIIIPRAELLGRLSLGADPEEIHRAMHPPRRSVQLPVVGEVTWHLLGGIGVFVLVIVWWWTPLAPIKIRRAEIQDLTIPMAEEIAGASLAFSGGTVATILPPVVPSEVVGVSRRIDKDRADAYLLGLKAIAEGRFGDARGMFADARETRAAPAAQIQLAEAQNEMYAGRFATAAGQYEKLLKAKPDDPMLLCQTAVAWMHAGLFDKAKPHVAKIAKLAKGKLPQDKLERGFCLHVQSLFCAATGSDYDDGEQLCYKMRQDMEKSLPEDHPLMVASLNNQAVFYALRTNFAGAEQLHNDTRESWQERLFPRLPTMAGSYYSLAMIHLAQGHYTKAQQAVDQSRGICCENLAEEHLLQAVTQHGEAVLQLTMGQYPEARTTGEQALGLLEKTLGVENPKLIPIVGTLGAVYAEQGLYVKAESHYARALRLAKAAWGPKNPSLVPILCHQGRLYLTLRRTDEAKKTCNEAFEIAEETIAKTPTMAAVLNLRAAIQIKTGDPSDAKPDIDRALEIYEGNKEKLVDNHPGVIRIRLNAAVLSTSARALMRAVTDFGKAIEQMKTHLGPDHPEIADLQFRLAGLYFRQGKYAEANDALKEALAIQENTLMEEDQIEYHPKLAKTLDAMAAVLEKTDPGDTDGAAALRARAQAIRNQHAKIDRPPEKVEPK